ncbi:MAG: hypothetical protein QG656_325, partial [Candidatus Hydrogenedentes bacterium]|nr:hypothetical protein [Candidatus Hydrogenedentota bacterium]
FDHLLTQDLESHQVYLPDFKQEKPFQQEKPGV